MGNDHVCFPDLEILFEDPVSPINPALSSYKTKTHRSLPTHR